MRFRMIRALLGVCAVVGIGGCGDGPTAASPDAPAGVRLSMAIAETGGGVVEAYDRADRISVIFRTSEELRLRRDLPFDPAGSSTNVSVEVPLRAANETFSFEVELLSEDAAIFAGGGSVGLSAGASTLVEASLSPVIAGVSCSAEGLVFDEYGVQAEVRGVALFATGDTVPGSPIDWVSDDESVAEVSGDGVVTSRGDGETRIRCLGGAFADTLEVAVLARVAAVQVTPPAATVVFGTTAAFGATLFDSAENEITTPREVTWSSSDEAVATVNAEGVATGLGVGVAWIRAASGQVADSAELTVIGGPTVETVGSVVDVTEVRLQGLVDPAGLTTLAWFEWGTDPALETFEETESATVDPGPEDVPFTVSLSGVEPGTVYYFRAAARNTAGMVRGAILSFTTAPAPTVETAGATLEAGGALLQGLVNTHGLDGEVWFEWGTDAGMTAFQETLHDVLDASVETIDVEAAIGNLLPGTTYYFRVAAASEAGTSRGDILSFTTPAPPTVATLAADITDGLLLMHATVDPRNLDTRAWFEWGEDPELVDSFTTDVQEIAGATGEITIDGDPGEYATLTTYYFRVVAENDAGMSVGDILTFRVQPPPEPQTLRSLVEGLQAVVYGSVDPLGEDTEVWFEIATDPEFQQAISTPIQVVPGDAVDVTITENVTDLQPGTRYFFRMWARNSGGSRAGETLFLDTAGPPTAETLESSGTPDLETVLHGLVNPRGHPTEVVFEMDLDPGFADPITIFLDSLAPGYEEIAVDAAVGEVVLDTIYYYRVVARNMDGEATGETMTFRSAPLLEASIELPGQPWLASAAVAGQGNYRMAAVSYHTIVERRHAARPVDDRAVDARTAAGSTDSRSLPGRTPPTIASQRGSVPGSFGMGSAKATYASPGGVPSLPPPAAITMNWRPSTM